MKRLGILYPITLISICFLLGQAASSFNGTTGQGKGAPSAQGKSPAAPTSVFIVTTADDHDDGSCTTADCTLREAILAANANAGADTINFAIGSGAQTIALNAALPLINGSVTLDAT